MSWFKAADPQLPDLIELNAQARPSHPAVICGETTRTWREFSSDVAQTAAALDALGVSKGDRVVVLMRNGYEMLLAMLGTVQAGAVAVPLNVSVSEKGMVSMIADSDARAIIASHEHVGRIEAIRDQLPANTGDRLVAHADKRDGWRTFERLLDSATPDYVRPAIGPEDHCNIIYSSGTTGLPKGIVHSHACRMAWAYDMSLALRYHSGARTLITLGLFSNITWVALLGTILCCGTIIVMPRFDARGTLSAIGDYRATHGTMVPVQFQRMLELDDFDDYDLSSIGALMCCGSPLRPELKLEILDRIPGDFIELYGLTEGLVTIQDPEDARANPSSVGRPCPGQAIMILGDDDRPVGPDTSGEIIGYGRTVMTGYLNRDEASEEAAWIDEDGRQWLRTGDIGRLDEDGNLYIVDRKKDMIISGGQNIYPADIETVIAAHEQVSDVAVIGVESRKWGETPLAVVVTAGEPADEDALIGWTNERVGKQQRIAGVRFIDELPRNPNGKVLKRELREQFSDISF